MREHQLRLSSGELSFFTAGEGRPLVYLHPAGGVRWSPVLDGLAQSHALHVPVVPGFDGTPAHDGVTSPQQAARLIGEFIDKTIGKPCDVIGYSFGGRIALWLAAERADLVDHLVLEGPGGFRRSGGGLPTDPDELRRALFAHPEKLPKAGPSPHEAANRRATLAYNKGVPFDQALFERLPAIGCMTLILHGTADTVCPADAVQLLKGALKRSFLVYIWDSAHAMEIDQPERVLEVIGSFLGHSEAFVVNWGGATINEGAA